VALVLDALRSVRADGIDASLTLLGSPGPASASGRAWQSAAAERGVSQALSFSGTLEPQALSDALAAKELLLFIDAAGPSGRKGTLAGALASGTPVLAIDGPRAWPDLVAERAVEVAAPVPDALAGAIAGLLGDRPRREELGARGRAFYDRRMAIARSVEAVHELLGVVLAGRASRSPASGSRPAPR
jgi:glycosyltransferase involved in cell wall biosynthesis